MKKKEKDKMNRVTAVLLALVILGAIFAGYAVQQVGGRMDIEQQMEQETMLVEGTDSSIVDY